MPRWNISSWKRISDALKKPSAPEYPGTEGFFCTPGRGKLYRALSFPHFQQSFPQGLGKGWENPARFSPGRGKPYWIGLMEIMGFLLSVMMNAVPSAGEENFSRGGGCFSVITRNPAECKRGNPVLRTKKQQGEIPCCKPVLKGSGGT